MGFPHANCGGGCIKAGQSQFARLLDQLPDRYAEWERHEQELRADLGDVAILRDRTRDESKPLTLTDLRLRIESGQSIPMFDFVMKSVVLYPTAQPTKTSVNCKSARLAFVHLTVSSPVQCLRNHPIWVET